MEKTGKKLFWVTLTTIAMGMLESSVVVYLRELYYPGGFQFPVHPASTLVAVTELIRELATLIMLIGIGVLAGNNRQERFAWFIFSFAIWDIFYYVFLYLLIGWPVTVHDWDILFLWPVMWTGPVWAPLVLSSLMILLALLILYFSEHGKKFNLKIQDWTLLWVGSVSVITAFCREYYLFMTSHHPTLSTIQLFFSKNTGNYAAQFTPAKFDIGLFSFGCLAIGAGIVLYAFRNTRELNSHQELNNN
jgi:phosphoglycerol transferase MdoB-like AlkP superfamily enzyme